jgi:hypothetical protein
VFTPDELSLLEFFESEPITRISEDGYFCYQASDHLGITLFFSFNIFETSVQVRLVFNGEDIALFSSERAKKITLENDKSGHYLTCEFDLKDSLSKLELRLKPFISVRYFSIRIE